MTEATNPVFLIVSSKLSELDEALSHLSRIHAQQCSVRDDHPDQYLVDVHAESLVTNIVGIYSQAESMLKRMLDTIDGPVPGSESWHRDLLLQAYAPSEIRPQIISQGTLNQLSDVLSFRHAVRLRYASKLRHDEVFRNLGILLTAMTSLKADLNQFVIEIGQKPSPEKPDRYR